MRTTDVSRYNQAVLVAIAVSLIALLFRPTPNASSLDTTMEALASSSKVPKPNGKVSAAYFVNWAIYGRKHFPWEVPFDRLTTILYSFANVRPETGEVYLTDAWADEQIHWAERGDSWNDPGNNLYGCFNQLRQAKLQHRHLKVLLSIGGWTYSAAVRQGIDSESKRAKFAESCVTLIEDYGLDGIDVDFEYPENDAEAKNFVALLKTVRHKLDDLAKQKGEKNGYLLTIAAPCGSTHYSKLRVKEMDKYLSSWHLMAYDYAGSWNSISGHQANLYTSPSDYSNQDSCSTSSALSFYTSQGVAPSKLVVGMPLYGRSFASTDGMGRPFAGVGGGSFENGVYDYKALPQPGAITTDVPSVVGTFDYNPSTRELVSYDSQAMASIKACFIRDQHLGGAMWWETSGDKTVESGQSLTATVSSQMGKLDSTPNHIWFPKSKFDNLRSQASGPEVGALNEGGYTPPPPPVPHNTRPGFMQKVVGAFQ